MQCTCVCTCGASCVFNARLYPAIFDNIIDMADFPTLRALRALSRHCRQRVDTRFATHVVLKSRHPQVDWSPEGPKMWPTLRLASPHGRIPGFMEWDIGNIFQPECEPLPGLVLQPPLRPNEWFQDPAQARKVRIMANKKVGISHAGKEVAKMAHLRARMIRALPFRQTNVVDLVGPVQEAWFGDLLACIKQYITLRLRLDEWGSSPWARPFGHKSTFENRQYYRIVANRLVMFEDLRDGEEVEDMDPDFRPDDHTARFDLYPHVSKVVVNYKHQPGTMRFEPNLIDYRCAPPTLREVVHVFTSTIKPPHPPDVPTSNGIFFGEALSHMAHVLHQIPQTLVGITEFDPDVFDLGPYATAADIQDRIRQYIAGYMLGVSLPPKYNNPGPRDPRHDLPPALVANLRFMTTEEYRAWVGEVEFAIETDEDYCYGVHAGSGATGPSFRQVPIGNAH